MTHPFGLSSLLEEKARQLNVNLQHVDIDARLTVYRDTLADLEYYFDTGDLGDLTKSSINVIIKDILSMIGGLRLINIENQRFSPALEELRKARDELQVASRLYRNDDITSPSEYFAALRNSRNYFRSAITLLEYTQRLAGDPTIPPPPPEEKNKKRKGT